MTKVTMMNETTELFIKKAILLYGETANDVDYASIHEVGIVKKKPVIMAGRGMSLNELREITRNLNHNEKLRLIDDRVLAKNGETTVFWVQKRLRATWMDCKEPFGKMNNTIPHPTLIFFLSKSGHNHLSIFAIKGNQKPDEETLMFKSPYFNVNEMGSVCMGDRNIGESDQEDVDAVVDAFFTSAFTHPGQSEMVRYAGGAFAFWSDMMQGRFSEIFPEEVLVPYMKGGGQVTLGDLLGTASR